jgi:hypothetical protein
MLENQQLGFGSLWHLGPYNRKKATQRLISDLVSYRDSRQWHFRFGRQTLRESVMARIYLSSTYRDLKSEREAVYRVLRAMGHEAYGMEDSVATDQRPLDKVLADVVSSDLYVGIFAWWYGYIPEENNPNRLSITELEFRQARESNIPCLIFLLHEDAPWPAKYIERSSPGYERIVELREELLREYLVSFFATKDELAAQVSVSVQNWQHDAIRDIAGTTISPSGETIPQPSTRNRVFVSYSHRDARWLSRLHVHLRVIERLGTIDLWSDTKITPGANWVDEIESALNGARAAVLLLSADFLASEFIMSNELPPLLAAKEETGLVIIPVIVSACRFQAIKELAQLKAINDPKKPLNVLSKGRQEQILDTVTEMVLGTFS